METLLNKVKEVEKEAREKIGQAEINAQKEIADMLAHEKTMLAEVRERAEARGEAILKERTEKDHSEVGQVVAAGKKAVEAVEKTASQNRKRTVEQIVEMFRSEYVG